MKTVYFLRAKAGHGPIKIGCSQTPAKRLRDIEIWSPYVLEILATAPGEFEHESALHYKFAADRAHGEWFNPTPALLALIDGVRDAGALPPLEIPKTPEQYAKRYQTPHRLKRRGEHTVAKSKVSKAIREAEQHAYGFGWWHCVRPDEIAAIMRACEGWVSPPPSADNIPLIDEYVAHLRAMPKADTTLSALRLANVRSA